MIVGVVFYEWWLLEMTTLFLASAIVFALVVRLKEHLFISQFIDGAKGLLGVALIIGTARGVTIVLNDGNISDSIIHGAAGFAGSMPPAFLLYLGFFICCLHYSSRRLACCLRCLSWLASILVHVPGREL